MRLIDADALIMDARVHRSLAAHIDATDEGYLNFLDACGKMLEEEVCGAKTVDDVPVVRCKDCEHYCMALENCDVTNFWRDPDGFCNYGQRRGR